MHVQELGRLLGSVMEAKIYFSVEVESFSVCAGRIARV